MALSALKHLQSAPSQKAVDDIFLLAFNNREKPIASSERKGISEMLGISAQEAQDVCSLLLESGQMVWLGSLVSSLSLLDLVVDHRFCLLVAVSSTSIDKRVPLPELRGRASR
jgi:hypothetical protein